MTWLEAQKKMEERGYSLKMTGYKPGARMAEAQPEVSKHVYIKEVGGIRLEAHVETPIVDCDTCWKVSVRYYGLKMFMMIDSQPFRFHDDSLFSRVEEHVLAYVHVIINSHI